MADTATTEDVQTDGNVEDQNDAADVAAVDPFAVVVAAKATSGGSSAADPRLVAALAAAFEGQPLQTRLVLPNLPANPTKGAAGSQAYKVREALKEAPYNLLVRADGFPVEDGGADDTPHRWGLTLKSRDYGVEDQATTDTTTTEDQATDDVEVQGDGDAAPVEDQAAAA